MNENDPAIKWLFGSKDPSIEFLVPRDLLDEEGRALEQLIGRIPTGSKVRALLSGQRADGGFGVHPYRKWTGSHCPTSSWKVWSLTAAFYFSQQESHRYAHNAKASQWIRSCSWTPSLEVILGMNSPCLTFVIRNLSSPTER